MIKHILILGGGSAGFITAVTLKTKAPHLEVAVVRSREIGIIGVGEGSTFALPDYLHNTLRIERGAFFRVAQPVWKLGIRFFQWGPRPFFDYTFAPQLHAKWNDLRKAAGFYLEEDFSYGNLNSALMSHNRIFARSANGNPQINNDFGYHIENRHFVEFIEEYAERLGVAIIEDTVTEVRQDERGVSRIQLESGRAMAADLYVDASGFVSLLLGKTLNEPFVSFKSTLFCDCAIVGGWERSDEPIRPYTTAEGMNAGWCWQIEHEQRINRGYVYASEFISHEEAEREFLEKNPKVESTRIVRFVSGRYVNSWVKNVVAIGNSCGFVEPLEATSLGVICDEAHWLAETLLDSDMAPTPTLIHHYNKRTAIKWDNIRRFLALHYRFNTRFDTPFWRACRADVELAGAEEMVEYYHENGPSALFRQTLLDELNQFGMEGYLSLLVGQKVPYIRRYDVPQQEMAFWNNVRQHLKAQGMNGFTIPEALENVRAGRWRFAPPAPPTPTTVLRS